MEGKDQESGTASLRRPSPILGTVPRKHTQLPRANTEPRQRTVTPWMKLMQQMNQSESSESSIEDPHV